MVDITRIDPSQAPAVDWLRAHRVQTIRVQVCADNLDVQQFWQGRGFEPDMVCLSLYPD